MALPSFRQRKIAHQNGAASTRLLTAIRGSENLGVAGLTRRASGRCFGGLFLCRACLPDRWWRLSVLVRQLLRLLFPERKAQSRKLRDEEIAKLRRFALVYDYCDSTAPTLNCNQVTAVEIYPFRLMQFLEGAAVLDARIDAQKTRIGIGVPE